MSSHPTISVLITCFNLGEYLDEAVASVLAQTYQDFEILIVDDGSTDVATRKLLDAYSRPKTTVFRTDNHGLAAARNFLIERASGEYLCALDADDRLHPEYFAKTVAAFAQDPRLTFAGTHVQMFGIDNRIWPSVPSCDLTTLLGEDTVNTAALVRRTAVVAVGCYDANMPAQGDEDWDLWIKLVAQGYRGVILPDVLFFYRRRPDSMCVNCTTGDTHLALLEYLLEKHEHSFREHLLDVLAGKEGQISDLRSEILSLEVDLGFLLRPGVERRSSELAALQNELARARAGRQEITPTTTPFVAAHVESGRESQAAKDAELQRLRNEVQALRNSWSWSATRPLRAVYEMLARFRNA